jgi:hypothetical protein
MQYILTEAEFAALNDIAKNVKAESKKIIGDLCIQVADNLPVDVYWSKNPEPWGCIITRQTDSNMEWYCDKCPVQKVCPHPKNWSKYTP